MNLPKITIITPSYNQGEFLEETIRSVLDQGYPDLEYFVVDGGSTDNSVEIIKRYAPHFAWWVSEKDRGQSHAINKGLERATGDIVTWLNSDDFFYPGALEMIAQAWQAHPEAGLFIGNGTLANRQGQRVRRYSKTLAWDYEILLHGANYVLQPATFLNGRVFKEQGLIDEKITYGMDLELWLRVGNKYPVVTIDEELAAFRWYDEVKSVAGGFKEWVSMFEIIQRYCKDPITPGMVVEFFKKLLDPKIQTAAGFAGMEQFAQKAYWTLYTEMQNQLQTDDCIPRANRGISFTPRRNPQSKQTTAKPHSAPARKALASREKLRVDVVLPEGHSWFVREGYVEALRRLGCLGRTFYVSSWKPDDERSKVLFDYLREPRSDVILAMDTLWHAQQVHATAEWQERWAVCPARKIMFAFECMNNPLIRANARWWNDTLNAIKQAAPCADAFIYAHELDGELFRHLGKPAFFQPFAVDETIFPVVTDFATRKPRAFFKGKAERFYDDDNCYRQRRELIEFLRRHAPNTDVVDQYSFAEGSVLQRNQQFIREMEQYQVIVGLPSLSPTMVMRPFEAMLAGCLFIQNRIEGSVSNQLFRDGEHLLYYDAACPDQLLDKINEALTNRERARRIAENGRREVLAKHTIRHRIEELLPWIEQSLSKPETAEGQSTVAALDFGLPTPARAPYVITVPAKAAAPVPPPTRGNKILIDGVTFQLQRGHPAGISRVWASLLAQLANSHLAKDIILLDRANTAPRIPGIEVRSARPLDIFRFESDSIYMQSLCEREGAALFVSTYYTYPENTHSMILLHDMIPEVMGQDLTHPEWRSKTKAIEKACAYLSVSQATLNDFRRLFPQYSDRKTALTPNAVGDELQPAEPSQIRRFLEEHNIRKPYFLLVGNRTLYKNAMLFFRAFPLLADYQGLEVVCVGGASELENVFKPSLQGVRCHLLRLTDAELAAAYGGALALVYPSQYEGFGLPILEAQKCGCPVITCRNSSIPEVAGDTVRYVGESDVAGMATALNEVRRPEVREQLIEAGRRNCSRFSWTATGQTLCAALDEARTATADKPLRAGDRLESIDRLTAALSVDNPRAKELGRQLCTLNRLYRGFEKFDGERLGATEAVVAGYLSQLLPSVRQQLAPVEELDSVVAFVLGLEAEVRNDWRQAWKLYTLALKASSNDTTPIYHFRLGVRLAKAAERGGDPTTGNSVMEKIVQPLKRALPQNIRADDQETEVRNWKVDVRVGKPPTEVPAAGKNDPPLISAIISTYKSERFLRGCLEDLEAQTIADRLEIIVIDSHSPQNERAIVQEFQARFSNIVYIRTDERETIYGAWNRGILAARGQYLTNANTDDRHRDDAYEILARTLDENPDVTLVYADCLVTRIENEVFESAHPSGCYQWLEFSPKTLLQQGCFTGPQPMWRREVHDEYGYFDANMVASGDYDFWLRLAQSCKFLHVKETLGLYLESPTSVEHANREAGAREVKIAQDRYRDAILYGNPAVCPKCAVPQVPAKVPSRNATLVAPPALAHLGDLSEARAHLSQKDYAVAWNAVVKVIENRPFHPEAFMLLAEIAQSAGDSVNARHCAQHVRALAPAWKAPKQFLKGNLRGNAKPDWLVLPEGIGGRKTEVGGQRSEAKGRKPEVGHRLTVCVIAKNEEQFIGPCLQSVKDVASQLIVVDTGSTDRTVAIAKEQGAEVYSFAWCDDFSAARNAALEHATGDWVLMLDADEELPAGEHDHLRADMKKSQALAFRLPLINRGQEAEGQHYVPRLYRNVPGVYYYGRIHEQVFPCLLPYCKAWGLETGLGTAQLLHHGYAKEVIRDRNKIERNLRLLRQAVVEWPEDPNLAMNLGLELVRSGDLPNGLTHYREAYRLMSAQAPRDVVPELREVLLTQFTCHLYKARQYSEVGEVLRSPLAKIGGLTASLHYALGLASFELKDYREAAEQMRQCLTKRKQPALSPINTDILTVAPQHCLALSLAGLEQFEEADKAFQAALQEDPASRLVRFDYARFQADRGQPIEALKWLHQLVGEKADDVAVWTYGGQIALGKREFLEFACDWTSEAIRHCPNDPGIQSQRAEVLLLSQTVAEALAMWRRLPTPWLPRPTAGMVICELVTSGVNGVLKGTDETAVSQEFIRWYQRLLSFGAVEVIQGINGRIAQLRPLLPSATRILEAAMAEAKQS